MKLRRRRRRGNEWRMVMRRDVEYEMRMHLKADSILSHLSHFFSSHSSSLLVLSFPSQFHFFLYHFLSFSCKYSSHSCRRHFPPPTRMFDVLLSGWGKRKKDDRRKKKKESVWVKERKPRKKQPNKISISQQTVFFSFFLSFFASILEVLEQRTLSSLWKKKLVISNWCHFRFSHPLLIHLPPFSCLTYSPSRVFFLTSCPLNLSLPFSLSVCLSLSLCSHPISMLFVL